MLPAPPDHCALKASSNPETLIQLGHTEHVAAVLGKCNGAMVNWCG